MKLPEEKTETSFVQPPALEKGIIMSLLECYIAPLFLPSVFLFFVSTFYNQFPICEMSVSYHNKRFLCTCCICSSLV